MAAQEDISLVRVEGGWYKTPDGAFSFIRKPFNSPASRWALYSREAAKVIATAPTLGELKTRARKEVAAKSDV